MPQDAREYEESVKIYRDLTNVVNTAERKGRAAGREEGRAEGLQQGLQQGAQQAKLENARRMKELGMGVEVITQVTGLNAEQIEQL